MTTPAPPVPPWKDGVDAFHGQHRRRDRGIQRAPIGLGHRVPLIAISPWSKGGKVSAEVFDHTRCCLPRTPLRRRRENISPWRRAVCGDLTSLFDFQGAGDTQVAPDLTNVPQSDARKEDACCSSSTGPVPSTGPTSPRACPARKRASALPSRCPTSCTPRWPSTSPPASCA
ncbi:alkaline phosphatase family protein [Pseudomonas aeruginosa]